MSALLGSMTSWIEFDNLFRCGPAKQDTDTDAEELLTGMKNATISNVKQRVMELTLQDKQ